MKNDRWLKRIWLANGILLLPFMLLCIGLIAYAIVWESRSDPEPQTVDVSDDPADDGGAIRAVRFDSPVEVYGSSTAMVQVRYGSAWIPEEFYGVSGYRSGYWGQPVVNVLFVDPAGSVRKLLDRTAYVRKVNYPVNSNDSLQQWISYEIAFIDTDGDGQLGNSDDFGLYISDLDGRRFQTVLPNELRLRSHAAYDEGRQILVYAFETSSEDEVKEEQLPLRAYLFDLEQGVLSSFMEFNDAIDMVAATVGR